MAESIVHGVLAGKLAAPGDISVGEPIAERRAFLSSEFGVLPMADNLEAVDGADLVVLAVKPQDLGGVLGQLNGSLQPQQAALSIVAGARMSTLSGGLNHGAVVRVMPNTPAQVGSGMTLWTCSPGVGDAQREMTRSVLSSVGEEIYVTDEKYMDMATALSASGPAYVFLFIEALIDAGVYVGMPRDMARTLVPADGVRQHQAGNGDRAASRGIEGYGRFSRGHHRRGAAHPRRTGSSCRHRRRRGRRLQEVGPAGTRISRAPVARATLNFFFSIINYAIILFTLAIFVKVIMSFVVYFVRPPYPPLLVSIDRVVNQITEPVLAPVRRMLPSFGGLDFSPMVVIIVLMLIRAVLVGL